MSENIHMRFYDANFMDFDADYEGYSDALLSLTRVRKPHHIAAGLKFFKKYADRDGHMHQALCRDCYEFLRSAAK